MGDEDAWARYRQRVEGDSSLARRVSLGRWVDEIADRLSAIDVEIGQQARALSPGEYAVFLEVLGAMQRKVVGAGPDAPAPDYVALFQQFVADLAAGKVTADRWQPADRLANLQLVAQRAQGQRMLVPVLPSPAPAPQPPVSPGAVAAAAPLYARYGELVPRLAPGLANAALDSALTALLEDLERLCEQYEAGGADWKHVRWAYAMVAGALARSAGFQGLASTADEWFDRAAQAWSELGDDANRQDCLVRAAAVALEDGAYVDQALEQILADLERADEIPSLPRAQLLARCAELYLSVSDYFDASDKVKEAAQVLSALGFPDPAISGLSSAFATWVNSDCNEDLGMLPDNRTLALFAAVATTWSALIGVRVILPEEAGNRHLLSSLLSELAGLTQKLGQQASEVGRQVWARAVAAGLAPAGSPANPAPTGDKPAGEQATTEGPPLSSVAERLIALQDAAQGGDPAAASYAELVPAAAALEDEARAAHLPEMVATAAAARADVLFALNRHAEAVPVLSGALDEVRGVAVAEARRRVLAVELLKRLALAHAIAGDMAQLSQTCGSAIAETEYDRGKVNAPYLQDSYLRDRRRLYDMGVFSAYKLGEYGLMLARAELAKARGVLGWAGARSSGGPRLDPSLEHELRALSDAVGGGPGASTGPGRPEVVARRRALWNRLMMARHHPEGTVGTAEAERAAPAFDLAALQGVLAPDEAVVYHYWLSRQTLLIVTLDQANVEVDKVDYRAEERDELGSLVADLAAMDRPVGWIEDELAAPGRRLLPDKGRNLLTGKQRLILCPQGILHQLPFAAFTWEGRPLIESFALSYVPNLTSMLVAWPEAAAPEVLALGISHFENPAWDLTTTGTEAATIAGLYQQAGRATTCLVDDKASRARVRELDQDRRLRRFGVVHLATHGDSGAPDDPFAARLFLYDGTTDGLEISQWQLNADLVVLSACYLGQRAITGRRRGTPDEAPGPASDEDLFGDEVFGLQAALFAAGAGQVLGALWRAEDEVAPTVMAALHTKLIKGAPTEVALQEAMTECRKTKALAYSWAPFKLVALGRRAGP